MMHGMHGSKCKGAMLLVLGILFFLGTLGVWPEFTFVKYWPLFLILWGLHDVACGCSKKMMGKGKDDCCGGGACECK